MAVKAFLNDLILAIIGSSVSGSTFICCKAEGGSLKYVPAGDYPENLKNDLLHAVKICNTRQELREGISRVQCHADLGNIDLVLYHAIEKMLSSEDEHLVDQLSCLQCEHLNHALLLKRWLISSVTRGAHQTTVMLSHLLSRIENIRGVGLLDNFLDFISNNHHEERAACLLKDLFREAEGPWVQSLFSFLCNGTSCRDTNCQFIIEYDNDHHHLECTIDTPKIIIDCQRLIVEIAVNNLVLKKTGPETDFGEKLSLLNKDNVVRKIQQIHDDSSSQLCSKVFAAMHVYLQFQVHHILVDKKAEFRNTFPPKDIRTFGGSMKAYVTHELNEALQLLMVDPATLLLRCIPPSHGILQTVLDIFDLKDKAVEEKHEIDCMNLLFQVTGYPEELLLTVLGSKGWQINSILSRVLLGTRFVLRELRDTWLAICFAKRGRVNYTKIQDLSMVLERSSKLQMRMQSFLNILETYISSTVEEQVVTFQSKLAELRNRSTHSFDEIFTQHREFLDVLCQQCILFNGTHNDTSVLESVLKIIRICSDFHRVCKPILEKPQINSRDSDLVTGKAGSIHEKLTEIDKNFTSIVDQLVEDLSDRVPKLSSNLK